MSHSHPIKIAPSILAADFAQLGNQVRAVEAAGADRIHIDVMDGHFVPNISMGPLIVKALRPVTALPLECHLMIDNAIQFIGPFADAGADTIIVHVENDAHLNRTIQAIRTLKKKVGVALNPATPTTFLDDVIRELDLVLAMTVNPGFGGQAFIDSVLPRISRIRELIRKHQPSCELEVDGGIDAVHAREVTEAGADVLVAGSFIFGAENGIEEAMQRLLRTEEC